MAKCRETVPDFAALNPGYKPPFDHLVGANETWAQKSYDIEGGIRLLAGPLQVQ
jgi:hypothetical protein